MKEPCVYLLASRRNGTLYCGSTSNLPARVHQHRHDLLPGFSSRYVVKLLVWFERHDTMVEAITRERRIKTWLRPWKLELIERDNPAWDDLAVSVLDFPPLSRRPALDPRVRGDDGLRDGRSVSLRHPRERGDPGPNPPATG